MNHQQLKLTTFEKIRDMLEFIDFLKVDMRVGTVLEAKPFPEARKPAFQIWIDFGEEIGILKTSAQLTVRYTIADLTGMQLIAVVNFSPKQIGSFMSECLILGAVGEDGDVVLMRPAGKAGNGQRIG
ncbi:MAG: tRNA-binding protein [Flavobacteriales bacterium]|jgi:tRNA-binding protein